MADGSTPKDCPTNEVWNPVEELPTGTITIRKAVNDVYEPFGEQSFLFEITGTDVAGDTHTYHTQVILTGKNGETTVENIPQGTYTITEISGIRYELRSVQPIKNAKRSGKTAIVTLTSITGNNAEVEFRNTVTDYGNESHTAIVVNRMEAPEQETLR